jgi:acyl transferase domain-containing protein/acyl-CoA synthetase (AMP-forming)/AMP-acid ligase II/NAD(P)-dependent dehydrogenase (short-subunit alcohol dehydrogenase family)/acyl carrier protein/SAM-dependent methyltransferase
MNTPRELSTLVDLLRWRADHQSEQILYTFLLDGESEETHLTCRELDRKARIIAAKLQSVAAPGERALLLYQPGLDFICAFFGCIYAGLIAVPAYPPRNSRNVPRIQIIAADAEATLCLSTSSVLGRSKELFGIVPGLERMLWLATDELSEGVDLWKPADVRSETLAYLQYTSGSTSAPKGVMISHRNLLHNLWFLCEGRGHTKIVSWLPFFHDMGLIYAILQALYGGIPCILMAPASFLQRPFRWLNALSRFAASTAIAPNFAYELCVQKVSEAEKKLLDLSRWTMALNAAEPVRIETLVRFADAFAGCGFRPEFLKPAYGLAEATLGVSIYSKKELYCVRTVDKAAFEQHRVVQASRSATGARELIGCGQGPSDQKIAIINPETLARCAPEEVGEIWLSSPSVAQGYWKKPEETKETFEAFVSDTGEGPFLRTGDLGCFEDDELFITGRLKDLIIIRGGNHYPQDIELTVQKAHPALQADSGAAFSIEVLGEERLVVVQDLVRHHKADLQQVIGVIREAVTEVHGVQLYAIQLVKPHSVPKTSSGKIQRHAARNMFLEDRFEVELEWRADFVQTSDEPTPSPLPGGEPATGASSEAPLLGGAGSGFKVGEQFILEEAASHNPLCSEFRLQAADAAKPAEAKPQSQPLKSSDAGQYEFLRAWLVSRLSVLLRISPDEINPGQPFSSYGLDSLGAVSLAGELQEKLARPLPSSLLFDYPSIESLVRHLAPQTDIEPGTSPARTKDVSNEPIAIIGLACRFPGAKNPQEFWDLLRSGIDAISEVPPERWDIGALYDPKPGTAGKMSTRWGGFLKGVDQFDADFFEISPREAIPMDPQQRLLMEVAWEALEDAAIPPAELSGSKTGVFIGISSFDYSLLQFRELSTIDAYGGTGLAHSVAANRISYFLNLRGPSIAVDTACSSSLVAIHQACENLRRHECDLALTGGVNLMLSPALTISLSHARMMAADGRCKTFDARADGYVRAEGCGMIVLKRLSDALRDGDSISALIQGSAVNQDGRSNGLTAPNGPAQEAVIREALDNAGAQGPEISLVECHGTGTSLGDPQEVEALNNVLSSGRPKDQKCWIGSVKTNIGHLEAAAGIAGVLKVVLSLKHKEIPAHLHFTAINPLIPLEKTPFIIPTRSEVWRAAGPRRAGVSSFGFGGTNAHVILAEAPDSTKPQTASERPLHLLTFSARTTPALREHAKALVEHIASRHFHSFENICFTSNTGRSHFDHRAAVLADSGATARAQLILFANGRESEELYFGQVERTSRPRIAFLFTGQGSQYVGMGRRLYETQPSFRRNLDRCDEILRPQLERSILSVLYPKEGESSPLNETIYAQPALFCIEYALAELWRSWGITPDAVLGHSVGEYAAACVAGIFDLESGLRLIAIRARLMDSLARDGQMAVVFAGVDRVSGVISRLSDQISIAAINGPEITVISGHLEAMTEILAGLKEERISHEVLTVSHAFHSSMMEPILQQFVEASRTISYHPPRIRFISNITGDWMSSDAAPDGDYWMRHIRQPVLFAKGISTLQRAGCTHFIECGPHPSLLAMGKRCLPPRDALAPRIGWLSSMKRGGNDWRNLLESLAQLYVSGASINWKGFDRDYARSRVSLPTYSFQRERFWVNLGGARVLSSPDLPKRSPRSGPGEQGAIENRGVLTPSVQGGPLTPALSPSDGAREKATQRKGSLIVPVRAEIGGSLLPRPVGRGEGRGEGVAQILDHPSVSHAAASGILWNNIIEAGQKRAAAGFAGSTFEKEKEKLGWLNKFSEVLLVRALKKLAMPASRKESSPGTIDSSSIEKRYRKAVTGWLKHLAARGSQPASSPTELWEKVAELWKGELFLPQLVRHCGQNLAEVLSGTVDPLTLVFHNGSSEIMEKIYSDSSLARYCNGILKELAKAAVRSMGPDQHIRILEIGAGTGATTSHILPDLPPSRTSYTFTDLGSGFIQAAQEKFSAFPFVQFERLNIEEDPQSQGFAGRQFDLVIAANVLHATRDLTETLDHVRSLLAPGALLFLWEATQEQTWMDISFSPLEGWQRFEDYGLRPDQPLLTPERWIDVLRAGFENAAVFPPMGSEGDAFGQSVIVAQARLLPEPVPEEDDSPASPNFSELLYDVQWIREDLMRSSGGSGQKLASVPLLVNPPPAPPRRGASFEAPVADSPPGRGEGVGSLQEGTPLGTWLIFSDAAGLGQELRDLFTRRGDRTVVAWLGEVFERWDSGRWRLDPSDSIQLDRFFQEAGLLEADSWLRGVIFLWSLGSEESSTPDAPDECFGCDRVVRILQRLVAHPFPEGTTPHLWLITRGAQPVVEEGEMQVAQSPLWGLGRSIAVEYPQFWGGLLDLDPTAPPGEAATLFQFLVHRHREDQIAWRGGQQYVCRLRHHQVSPIPSRPRSFPSDGTYLITGGLGGIGLEIARWLVGRGARRLFLLSRNGLPPRSLWRHRQKADPALGKRIEVVRELESLGASIHIEAVDVGDEHEVSAFIGRFRDELWPPIRGVFHAAGVIEDTPLTQLTAETLSGIFRPKIAGARLLAKYLPAASLDFIVFFSSAASLLGAKGSASYTAANAFLDAFAHSLRARGVQALSINWGSWLKTGMADRDNRGERLSAQGILSFSAAQALASLEYALSQPMAQLAVLSVDWDRYFQHNVRATSGNFLSQLAQTTIAPEPLLDLTAAEPPLASVKQKKGRERRETTTEDLIRKHVGEVLKREPASLDAKRPLHTLGLDSIMAVQLKNEFELHFNASISVREIAQSTIAELEKRVSPGAAPTG